MTNANLEPRLRAVIDKFWIDEVEQREDNGATIPTGDIAPEQDILLDSLIAQLAILMDDIIEQNTVKKDE